LTVKKSEEISDMIGDYNNRRNLLDHLKTFSSKAMEEDEQKAIKSFCDKEIRSLNVAKGRILTKVRAFVTESRTHTKSSVNI